MPSTTRPRSGSMQFWPRKKAKRAYARIRSWQDSKDVKPQGFMGYKVGMTHYIAKQENKNSHLKGENVFVPATIIECPPMKIYSARFYTIVGNHECVAKEIFFKTEKNLSKKIKPSKENKAELEKINVEDYANIMITVYTQPEKAGFGKKKPELFEMALGGSNADKLTFIKDNFDKEIDVNSIFEEGQIIDIHAITKGKGFQGAVKRFGIGLRNHKSEKGIRAPGSLGPWVRQQHISHRVPHAGQGGYHQRIEYNKQILILSNDLEKLDQNFHKYGNVKSTYIIVHGSIPGSKKRPIIMTTPIRSKGKKHQLILQ